MREPGKQRGVAFVVILSIVTIGIYQLYWLYKSFQEVKNWRGGRGANGIAGVLLSLIIIGVFLLPSYVGEMYKEDLTERGETGKLPISGWSGLFALIPYVGGIIWLIRVQTKLNDFWQGPAQRSAAATPAAPADA